MAFHLTNAIIIFIPRKKFVNNFIFNFAVARCPMFVHQECETQPLCVNTLMTAAKHVNPSIIDTIPSILEGVALLVRTQGDSEYVQELVECLAGCERVLYGGCSISTAAFETLSRHDIKIASQYGQTEVIRCARSQSCLHHLHLTPEGPNVKINLQLNVQSIRQLGGMIMIGEPGRAQSEMRTVPGCEWREGEDGELVIVNCEAAMLGYIHNGIIPSTHLTNAHRTRDLFTYRRDKDVTWLSHKCRKDDLIIHSTGEMTNPLPVEDSIASTMSEAIEEVCVIGQQRPYPVIILRRSSRWSGDFEKLLTSALGRANASLASYSSLRRDRVIMAREPMPTSAKGNIIRGDVEKSYKEILDELDGRMRGHSDARDGNEEQPVDSMQVVRRKNKGLSDRESVFIYLSALCMFSVVQAHALWPRLRFWTDPAVLKCAWLGKSGLLLNAHKGNSDLFERSPSP